MRCSTDGCVLCSLAPLRQLSTGSEKRAPAALRYSMAETASEVSPRKQHSVSVNNLRPSRSLLAEWTLARFLATRPPSHVVTLEADMTVGAALAALNRHSILSAPVVNAENADVVGIISVRDVLSAFLAGVYPGLLRGSTADAASLADELATAGAEFCERQLRALGYGGDGKLLYKARTSATLYELLSQGFLGDGAARPHHRVTIWDLDGRDARGDAAMRVTAVVSQSDIIRCARGQQQACSWIFVTCVPSSVLLQLPAPPRLRLGRLAVAVARSARP